MKTLRDTRVKVDQGEALCIEAFKVEFSASNASA